MNKSILPLLGFFIISAATHAQADSTLFDFWVGRWSASWKNADGTIGKGTNRIVKILDDKVIQENFEDESGFKGTSISVFNFQTKAWHQAWADNQGGYFDFDGGIENGKKFFRTKMKEFGNKKIFQRMVFYDFKSDSFTWDWEKTEDNGKTWALQWKINYVKLKN